MDFFKAQDQARSRTRWLVVWFMLALAGVMAVIYGLAAVGLLFSGASGSAGGWDHMGSLAIALVIGVVMLCGSLFKHLQLSGGGAVVARDLGGRAVDPSTTDAYERRLLNVVEEMSIASGTPMPEVWVLPEEEGINAFAAGSEPNNAVVAVTRGCLERLSRAELQGVVAHEFSHILNGDMRLNLRLIGWIFGLVMIAVIGRVVFSSFRHVRFSSGSSRGGKGAGGVIIAIFLIGLSLWIVGSIGVLFARMIQAAISRQREYLADASAVQFTREPGGLAGALKKIGALAKHGRIDSPRAGAARHLFFSEASAFTLGMATHPPLERRIIAIDPSWDGKFIEARRVKAPSARKKKTGAAPPPLPAAVAAAVALDGMGGPERVDHGTGAALMAGLDPEAVDAVRTRDQAKALLFGMLLAQDDELRDGELRWLRERDGDEEAELALQWRGRLAEARAAEKIAYIDLALPALRRMGEEERQGFIESTGWLISSDGQVDLFEFMLRKVLERHLSASPPPLRRPFKKIAAIESEVQLLVSTFAHLSEGGADEAFEAAGAAYREQAGRSLMLLPAAECSLGAIDEALDRCLRGTAVVRKHLLHLCGLAAVRDGKLSDDEIELLRAVAEAIGTPLPPFVGRELAA